jgi:RecA-family ATPase
VLAIFSEEDEAVLHRRMKTIASRLEVSKSACDRVYSVAAAGKDLRLVQAGKNGEVEPTQAFRDLRTLARKIPNLRLIILDPLSRLYGLPENDNTGPTVFISMLEALAQETGAAVMVSHHTRKAGKDGTYKTALDAESLRGASAFTGAIRWQMNITTMSKEEARKVIGVASPAQGQFLAARVCKKNYGPPEDEFFLERGDGGVLRPCDALPTVGAADYAEVLKPKIMEALESLEAEGTKITKKQLGDIFPPKWKAEGIPGASREIIRSVADMMIQNGELFEVKERTPSGKNFAKYLTRQK